MPAAIVPLAMSLIQTGIGAANKKKADAEAKALKASRPEWEISPQSTNELNLAESELQGGMGSRAERAYTQQQDKNISASLATILKGGGNLNNVADVYGSANEGMLRLAQIQDNLRLNQIQNTVTARRNYSDQLDKGFMYNQDQWWKADAQANATARTNSEKQLWGGINGAAGIATNFIQNVYEKKQMEDYLNPQAKEERANHKESMRIGNMQQQPYNPVLSSQQFPSNPNNSINPINPIGAFDPYGLKANSSLYNLNY